MHYTPSLKTTNYSIYVNQDSIKMINNEIYYALDYNPSLEVQGVFLDLSKAFDKVWHDGLICNLKLLKTM